MMLMLILLSCRLGASSQGTVVGNPGEATSRLAPIDSELTILSADAVIAFIDVLACDGSTSQEEVVDASVDLLEDVPLVIPGGTWCGFGLSLESVTIVGEYERVSFSMVLSPGFVETSSAAGVVVDGQDFIFEMAEEGWLSAELLDLTGEEDGEVVLEEGDPLTERISDTLALRSALFEDDGDGVLSDDERQSGPIAWGAAREADLPEDTGQEEGFSDDDSGGCGGGAALVLFPLLSPLARRRRSAGDTPR